MDEHNVIGIKRQPAPAQPRETLQEKLHGLLNVDDVHQALAEVDAAIKDLQKRKRLLRNILTASGNDARETMPEPLIEESTNGTR